MVSRFVSEQYDMTQKGVPSDPFDMTSAQRQQMANRGRKTNES